MYLEGDGQEDHNNALNEKYKRMAREEQRFDLRLTEDADCVVVAFGAAARIALSAVRAVNNFSACGRCYICPAYYKITSAVGPDGLPSEKVCPRDAIERTPIGWIDPDDPANNFYEYTIDETKCNGCGLCVMECKEPAGLSSIVLEVRHNVCLDCNRCSIASVCPEDAYDRRPPSAT